MLDPASAGFIFICWVFAEMSSELCHRGVSLSYCPKGSNLKTKHGDDRFRHCSAIRERSGSRMNTYLVNDVFKTIGANTKRADFALAA